jgi:hypothetical protein
MSRERECIFYRNLNSLLTGKAIGYCNLDRDWTVCDGNIKYCEKSAIFEKYLLKTGVNLEEDLPPPLKNIQESVKANGS